MSEPRFQLERPSSRGTHEHITETFPNMRAALEAAERDRWRSFRLWECPRHGDRVLRFSASS